jgi:N-acetylneuraminic acid mutarotase
MTIYKSHTLFSFITLIALTLSGCATKPVDSTDTFSLKTARYGHAAVNDGNKIYVIAGANKADFLSDIEIIDPKTKEIQLLVDKVIPRRYFSAVWDGAHSIYIIGGISLQSKQYRYERRVEIFNTQTHEVTFGKNIPIATRINTAVYSNDRIFVLGGTHPKNKKLTATALVAMLDIKQNKWIRAADMPTAKTTRAVVKDGLIYVVGGYDRSSSLNVFERFDPKNNQWQSLAPLPVNISAHSVSLVHNKLLVFGDYTNLSSTYAYDFDTEQWQKLNVNYKASRHNSTTTLGDITYVIGGNTGSNGPYLDYIQQFKL